MTSSFQIGNMMFISSLTLALFEDSGFYTRVKYDYSEEQHMSFGRGRGCTFLTITDCSIRPEYCNTNGLVMYNLGSGNCAAAMFADCSTRQIYTNKICRSETYFLNSGAALESNGWNSWGYNSTAVDPAFRLEPSPRCHATVCGPEGDYLQALIGKKQYVCVSGANITDEGVFDGQFDCPANVRAYCSEIMTCPDLCSNNQMCVRGICLGKCLSKQFHDGTSCVACPAECQECASLKACVSCPAGSNYRLQSLCLTCPSVAQFNPATLTCVCNAGAVCTPCGKHCRRCEASGCEACVPDFVLKDKACVPSVSCLHNYIAIGAVCFLCSPRFSNTLTNTCVTCQATEYFDFSKNQCVACPAGTTVVEYNNCGPCKLLISSGLCVSACPVGSKANSDRRCVSCTNCSARIDPNVTALLII
jgi:hypothetical protein